MMSFKKQHQYDDSEDQGQRKLSKQELRDRWRCAENGCPMPGGISPDRGGEGAQYYCRYHINTRGSDESPVITTRIRTLLKERNTTVKKLCESLRDDEITDKWIRTGSYPGMEPNLSTRLHEQKGNETETEAA